MKALMKTIVSGSAMLAAATMAGGIAQAAGQAGWSTYGNGNANTHYSSLSKINTKNVKNLRLAYALSLGTLRSNESTPIVVGDTMYVSSSFGPAHVYALNATSGKIKWVYSPNIPDDVMQYACCDVDSRGVTYADGKIFFGTLDGKLVALDAKDGKKLWEATVVDYKQGSVITSPPLVVKGMVVTGYGGGEYGGHGYLDAYDINTGKLAWKTSSLPDSPDNPLAKTWKNDSYKQGGGDFWLVGSYDPKSNLIYWGTSNPSPWNATIRSTASADFGPYTNKWTSSTLAIDATTGKIKWGYQMTPSDAWDYDGVNTKVLADIKVDGKKQPVLMEADRNGYFYVLNRDSGKLLSAQPFVHVNWSTGIDMKTGMPHYVESKRPKTKTMATDICPNLLGGANWEPPSYSPKTGLVYISSNNMCQSMQNEAVQYKKGFFYLGKKFTTQPGPGGYLGALIAWNPETQKAAWMLKDSLPFNGGVLSTGGNVVFQGTTGGMFRAVNAKTGKVLWEKNLGTGVTAAPITFEENGQQYVAVVAGRSQSIPAFLGKIGTRMLETPQGGMLFVFKL